MLEEALPIAVGVGAALLPAMAFGGLAAARAFIFLAAADSGVLAALEEGKSEEEAFRLIDSGAVASVVERAPAPKAPAAAVEALNKPMYGFAARFLQ
ncbi:hypothetical protein COO60DRAFT_1705982 [Scenedesmus sp. NREL 46B-D3]|nr:hypothetical protein COO60DRAFT_1705982 [Scenedesmus sp. NREL 46B-D3]